MTTLGRGALASLRLAIQGHGCRERSMNIAAGTLRKVDIFEKSS
jgi:hypothetical protein